MALTPFKSNLIADVGISFGDEGKGRLIPEVVQELHGTPAAVSVVFKVNGGSNSGHTAGGIKLNLLPAGVVVRDAAHLCIGSGVVADGRLAPDGTLVADSLLAFDQVKRQITAPSFRLAGGGWYETDFGSNKKNLAEKPAAAAPAKSE